MGDALVGATATLFANAVSKAWPANNQAIYIPFRLSSPGLARQFLFLVGATSSGNIDIGIYTAQKNRIISAGSTAMSASTNTVQQINITDTWLNPGEYLLGVSCSTTTGTVFGLTFNDEIALSMATTYEEASALPLPATATPAISTTATPLIPVVGIQFAGTF